MKKILSFLLAGVLSLASCQVALATDDLSAIRSEAYVVMDAQTGQVLVEKNMNLREYPASITKILTAALALEHGSSQDTVTMTDEAVFSVPRDTTHISLTPGEVVTVEQLLYATMLASANDAANGLATYTAGSLEAFADLMNEKAAELGAVNSHFVNANGLYDADHYVTAYDMALITKYALTVPGFREVFGGISYTIPPTNNQPDSRNLGTYHHMIVTSKYEYEGATGGKLGWTPESKHTIVTVANRGDLELICVALKTTTQYEKYEDTAALFDYCFENYGQLTYQQMELNLQSMETDDGRLISFSPGETLRFAAPKGLTKDQVRYELSIPAANQWDGSMAPTVTFLDSQGEKLATLPLEYSEAAVAASTTEENQPVDPSPAEGVLSVLRVVGQILVVLAVILVVGIILLKLWIREQYLRRRRQQRRKRRPMSDAEFRERLARQQSYRQSR